MKIALVINGTDFGCTETALCQIALQLRFLRRRWLVRVKEQESAIGTLALLRARYPDVHLVVVGEGEDESRLLAEAARLGLEDHVHLIGFRSDVVGILKSVDALVLPSLQEGIPLVALEAMACAVPVVATAVGGIPYVVIDGQTGFLFPPPEVWIDDLSGTSLPSGEPATNSD